MFAGRAGLFAISFEKAESVAAPSFVISKVRMSDSDTAHVGVSVYASNQGMMARAKCPVKAASNAATDAPATRRIVHSQH